MTARQGPKVEGVPLMATVVCGPSRWQDPPRRQRLWLTPQKIEFVGPLGLFAHGEIRVSDVEDVGFEQVSGRWEIPTEVRLEAWRLGRPAILRLSPHARAVFTLWAQRYVPDAVRCGKERQIAETRAELAEAERLRRMGPRPRPFFGVARKIFGPRLIVPHTVRVELTPEELKLRGLLGLGRSYPLERLHVAGREELVRRGCIDVTFEVSGQRLPLVLGVPASMLDDVLAWVADRGAAIRAESGGSTTAASRPRRAPR